MDIKPSLFIFTCEHGKICNFIADCNICAKAEITRLTAEVAELRKDAEHKRLPYGLCPKCGAAGISRERRPNGMDKCGMGHTYLSANAIDAAIKSEQKES